MKKDADNTRYCKKTITPILAFTDEAYRPFIEFFEHHPLNFTQRDLGDLFGFFYITNIQDDAAAHIVNFLTSEAKKEYLSHAKRGATYSLNAALHRVNNALAELAKHGNVSWLGTLDAAICALDKDTLHFSVTGDARVLLIRNGLITDISKGVASEEASKQPLKTFVDIASGQLQKDDLLLITAPELLSLFSLADILKYANRFTPEQLQRFLQTALVNERGIAAVFVVTVENIIETTQEEEQNITTRIDDDGDDDDAEVVFNAFSEQTFRDAYKKKADQETPLEAMTTTPKESTSTSKIPQSEKPGHIYISDDDPIVDVPIDDSSSLFMEQTKDAYATTKKRIRSTFSSGVKGGRQKIADMWHALRHREASPSPAAKQPVVNPNKAAVQPAQSTSVKLQSPSKQPTNAEQQDNSLAAQSSYKSNSAYSQTAIQTSILDYLAPVTDYIRKEKIFVSIVALISIAILFFGYKAFFSSEVAEQPTTTPAQEVGETAADADSTDTPSEDPATASVTPTIADGTSLFGATEVQDVVVVGDAVIGVRPAELVVREDGEISTHTLPEQGTIAFAATMPDLDLLFLMTQNNTIYAFSPQSKNFTKNTIEDLPQSVDSIAIYDTYFYTFSQQEQLVYRYSRITNGFNTRVVRAQEGDGIAFADYIDFAIDGDIFLATRERVDKIFQLKKEDFTLSSVTPALQIDAIETDENLNHLYILDRSHSRIVQFTKETGSVVKEFVHSDFSTAEAFAVDEDQKKLYSTTENGVTAFDME